MDSDTINNERKKSKENGVIWKNDREKMKKELNNKDSREVIKHEKKPCPVPNCDAKVIHLPKHLRNVHKWHTEYARTALRRFTLRKKYAFAYQETA